MDGATSVMEIPTGKDRLLPIVCGVRILLMTSVLHKCNLTIITWAPFHRLDEVARRFVITIELMRLYLKNNSYNYNSNKSHRR